MTIIQLTNGTKIPCESLERENQVLKIETNTELTCEELRVLFTNKENLSNLELQTESGSVLGYKSGFTCYAGLVLLENGNKCIELMQERELVDMRLIRAEGQAIQAIQRAEALEIEAAAYNVELDVRLSKIELGL